MTMPLVECPAGFAERELDGLWEFNVLEGRQEGL
jgi:hypothetical protein